MSASRKKGVHRDVGTAGREPRWGTQAQVRMTLGELDVSEALALSGLAAMPRDSRQAQTETEPGLGRRDRAAALAMRGGHGAGRGAPSHGGPLR